MTSLDKLREELEALPASVGSHRTGLPPFELRYVIEGRVAPPERPQIEAAIGTDRFILDPLSPAAGGGLDRFSILAFLGLDRRSFSTQALFEMGYRLCEALDLVSAEPDLNSDHAAEPEAPEDPHIEGADLAFWCWVNEEPPADRQWALRRIGIHQAWALTPGKGRGIRVAQPDTGVAAHAELDRASLRMDLSVDLVDGIGPALDPLVASAGNPGHGTATASVLMSGPSGVMQGSAPGVELVPIRCIESVILVDGAPVASALSHALGIGAHVVTMSLGGLPSRAVSASIRALVEEGCIVLAAAGNCFPEVVFPARYPHCIAVAGTDVDDRPWRGSSSGAAVDIAAPGQLVWRAVRRAPDDASTAEVSGGQGTSFATALAAGAVALWLSHHGRDALLTEARRRGVTLQALCRAALAATAHAPQGWDADRYGAGVLRADRLLALAPRDIPAVTEGPDEDDIAAELAALQTMTEAPPHLDLQRYGLEAAKLRFDSARTAARPGSSVEAPVASPSATYLRALSARDLTEAPAADAVTAPALHRPRERGRSAEAYVRILGSAVAGRTLESPAAAAEAVASEAPGLLRALEARFAASDRAQGTPPDAETTRLRATVLTDAERALAAAGNDPGRIVLDRRSLLGLEALIHTKGRPSLLVRGDAVDAEDPDLDDNWVEFLALAGDRVTTLIRATGRIEIDGANTGTGFVVAPGLLMTNRHVLEALVEDPSGRGGWTLKGDVEFNLAAEWGADARNAYCITGVCFAGPSQIGRTVDLRKLDLALLQVEDRGSLGKPLPAPLSLVRNRTAGEGRHELAVVGHPGRPTRLPRQQDGRLDPEVVAALERIFRFRYDVKRLALGRVDRRVGTVTGDAEPPWAFSHDATTLGGNSGSAIVLQGDDGKGGLPVLGLHMGGQWLAQNFAHFLAAVPELRDPALGLGWTDV